MQVRKQHPLVTFNPAQELYRWPLVAETSRRVLGLKYALFPYYYTLLRNAAVRGTPVLRPLFFEFSNDPNTLDVTAQFMVGPSVMVQPPPLHFAACPQFPSSPARSHAAGCAGPVRGRDVCAGVFPRRGVVLRVDVRARRRGGGCGDAPQRDERVFEGGLDRADAGARIDACASSAL